MAKNANDVRRYRSYVGESERELRHAFSLARLNSPSLLFFDEIDALTTSRDHCDGVGGSDVSSRILSTLLNEMDGIEACGDNVLIVGATNRPDRLDSALTRPGRFDRLIYVGMPDKTARRHILAIHTIGKGMHLKPNAVEDSVVTNLPHDSCGSQGDVVVCEDTSAAPVVSKVDDFVRRMADAFTDGMTGAEIESLAREAALRAIRRGLSSGALTDLTSLAVIEEDFAWARSIVQPKMLPKHLKVFEDYAARRR